MFNVVIGVLKPIGIPAPVGNHISFFPAINSLRFSSALTMAADFSATSNTIASVTPISPPIQASVGTKNIVATVPFTPPIHLTNLLET